KIEELENARAEIQKLGGDITALNAQIEELDKLKETVKSLEKYKSMYFRVKSEVDNANRLAADSKNTADGLKTMLSQQDSMMQMQKQALALKDQNISTLEQERAELSQKVALASILKADNIKIIAVSAKGKEKEGDLHKAKSISKLKIAFTISENRVATKNTKDIYIRIVEPDGATISTSTETLSGEFSYNNKTLFYSMKTSILYNGYITPVTVTYTKEDEYKIGKHIVEVYCEGSLIGTGTFTVE
ncbi:MAG: chromosome segregation ATPase, partial [Cytophagales bacterium]|nr:chromosome segregation ATPase [Cytophaga sp.]